MSFCPSKDIFSVYLDGEMPECYKKEFEAHLSECKKCSDELNKIKEIHMALRADAESIRLDDKFLDDSFARLQVKMKYSKNVRKVNKSYVSPMKFYIPVAVAAAAVFALVIPAGLRNQKAVTPAVSSSAVTVASNAIPNINSTVAGRVSSVVNNAQSAENVSFGSGRSNGIFGNMKGTVLSSENDGNVFVKNVSTSKNEASLIKDVDVFRPDFEEEKTISIKITVPGMNAVPYTTEIEMPVNVITGQF